MNYYQVKNGPRNNEARSRQLNRRSLSTGRPNDFKSLSPERQKEIPNCIIEGYRMDGFFPPTNYLKKGRRYSLCHTQDLTSSKLDRTKEKTPTTTPPLMFTRTIRQATTTFSAPSQPIPIPTK